MPIRPALNRPQNDNNLAVRRESISPLWVENRRQEHLATNMLKLSVEPKLSHLKLSPYSAHLPIA